MVRCAAFEQPASTPSSASEEPATVKILRTKIADVREPKTGPSEVELYWAAGSLVASRRPNRTHALSLRYAELNNDQLDFLQLIVRFVVLPCASVLA